MCVFQDIRIEDVILELKDGKDFSAVFMLGEKSFQIHLGMYLTIPLTLQPLKQNDIFSRSRTTNSMPMYDIPF